MDIQVVVRTSSTYLKEKNNSRLGSNYNIHIHKNDTI